MKKLAFGLVMAALLLSLLTVPALAAKGGKNAGCTTIPEGTLYTSDGKLITPGYDEFGYNYQAHMFVGLLDGADRNLDGTYWGDPTYANDFLVMKWNDAWLSNKDCDGDGKLDTHYGYDSYIGSGAWETNHEKGTYVGDDGKTYNWEYFCKIVAVPEYAYVEDGYWYTEDGIEIGPDIWGQFAIVQEVYNDQGTGEHGLSYKSPASPGFGFYKP